MAYDNALADQVRFALARAGAEVVDQAMFGGLAFMVRGHMTAGVLGDDILVRVGPEGYDEALTQPGARPMDFTGKPSRGIVFVAGQDLDDRAVEAWVERGLAFTRSLPPK